MKKILFPFVCLFLLFSNCQQNILSPPPSCGTGSFDLNGNPQITDQYIPILDTCTEAQLLIENGLRKSLVLTLHSVANNNNSSFDFQLMLSIADTNNILIGQNYTGGTIPYVQLIYYDLTSGNAIIYNNYDPVTLNYNGNFMITNLDMTNNLISGTYEFDGYNSNFSAIQITNGVFTNIPVRFQYH